MIADQCPRCAALRAEVADWRRLYQTLARSIAEAAQARQAAADAPDEAGTA
tara:strand:- start:6554 stop:6706 length:153 start_codon:yes stop_codon:yes gene_type:complete